MGSNHVRNYSEIEQADLVAISDLNEELGRALAAQYGCKYYKDHIEMLETEQLDAVTVVVPTRFHHKVGLDVLDHGVHLLIEKPIAMTIAEAEDLIRVANEKNLKLMVGHVERFNTAVLKLKELIDSGRMGDVFSIVAKRVFKMPNQINDADVLVDLAVHDIDIISCLLGSNPTRVRANGGKAHLEAREDHAEILLTYRNGTASGIVEVNWITAVRIRKMQVTGTGGYAEVDLYEKTLVFWPAVIEKTKVEDYQDLLVTFADPVKEEIQVVERESLRDEIESFLDSVRNDTPVYTPGEDGLAALKAALAAADDIAKNS
jgi:UDP-N-acetylglucosamine 3-dehydrogenase